MAKYKKLFVGSVGVAEAFEMKNDKYVPAFSSSTLTDSGLNIQTTKDDIRAGQGAAIQFSFYHDPSVEINLTDVLFKREYITAQLGADFEENGQYYKTTKLVFDDGETDFEDDILPINIPCTGGEQHLVWGYKVGSDEIVKMAYVAGSGDVKPKIQIVDDEGTKIESAEGPYCVNYLTSGSEAHTAEISTQIIPREYRLIITAPLFAGDACAASKGKPAGKIIFEVPRFQLNGAQDFAMNMSSNQTMSLAGIALASPSTNCDDNAGTLLRIMEVVLDPDGDWKEDVADIMSDEAYQKAGDTPSIYVIYKNGKAALLKNSEFTFKYVDNETEKDALGNDGKYLTAAANKVITVTLKGTEINTTFTLETA